MGLTYAIADLHGRMDLLLKSYEQIAAHPNGTQGTIIHLGDYVDRGPDSRQIIEFLMSPETLPPDWKRIVLKGNHEDMMAETLRKSLRPDWWIGNGGGATLISYGHPRNGDYDPSIIPSAHLDWLDRLPLMHVDKHRVFVHAGVDPTIPLDKQKEQNLLWWLYPDNMDIGHGERHVVHGHHQFADGPKCFHHRTDLDTFAWYTGRLVIGVFDDDVAGGPVDFIEILRAPA